MNKSDDDESDDEEEGSVIGGGEDGSVMGGGEEGSGMGGAEEEVQTTVYCSSSTDGPYYSCTTCRKKFITPHGLEVRGGGLFSLIYYSI